MPLVPSCDSNEALRHAEVRPAFASDRLSISEADRGVTVSWLMEVVVACGLQPTTLHLAVSYLDRFLEACKVWMRGFGS